MAKLSDAALLFEWRNDPETRRQSRSSGPLSYRHHLRWLRAKLSSSQSALFICEHGGTPVATVRLEREKGTVEVFVTVAPESRSRGHGREAVRAACHWAFSRWGVSGALAYIKQQNLASERLFSRVGFVQVGEQDEFTVWRLALGPRSTDQVSEAPVSGSPPQIDSDWVAQPGEKAASRMVGLI